LAVNRISLASFPRRRLAFAATGSGQRNGTLQWMASRSFLVRWRQCASHSALQSRGGDGFHESSPLRCFVRGPRGRPSSRARSPRWLV